MTPVSLQMFKNTVERILHVPGNFTEQNLEMAVVIDGALSREQVEAYVPELLGSLKRHSEVFRNVRLNVVEWKSDEQIMTQVRPMSVVMLHSFYEEYEQVQNPKHFEKLVTYLKLYQARSKLIILVTDGKYQVEHEDELELTMRPFLDKKLMQVVITGQDGLDIRYRFQRTV